MATNTRPLTPVYAIENITPKMAKSMIENSNIMNRPLSRNQVLKLAADMQNGNWMLTHQGIAISENGNVIDGQHRLHAIIEADTPVRMFVARNVQENVFAAIDSGVQRSNAHRWAVEGKRNTVALSAALKVFGVLEATGRISQYTFGNAPKSFAAEQEILSRWPELHEVLKFTSKGSVSRANGAFTNVVWTIICRIDIDYFYSLLDDIDNSPASKDTHEFICREYLLKLRTDTDKIVTPSIRQLQSAAAILWCLICYQNKDKSPTKKALHMFISKNVSSASFFVPKDILSQIGITIKTE